MSAPLHANTFEIRGRGPEVEISLGYRHPDGRVEQVVPLVVCGVDVFVGMVVNLLARLDPEKPGERNVILRVTQALGERHIIPLSGLN